MSISREGQISGRQVERPARKRAGAQPDRASFAVLQKRIFSGACGPQTPARNAVVRFRDGNAIPEIFLYRNVGNRVVDIRGAEGMTLDLIAAGDAGEDEDGLQAALDAADNIGVHAVADHN